MYIEVLTYYNYYYYYSYFIWRAHTFKPSIGFLTFSSLPRLALTSVTSLVLSSGRSLAPPVRKDFRKGEALQLPGIKQ